VAGDGAWHVAGSFGVGLGKEQLTAHGGASDYDGTSLVGGLGVSADARRGGSPLVASLALSAHDYTAEIRQVDEASGQAQSRELRFRRVGARLTGLYDLRADRGPGALDFVGVGVGLGYARLPLLTHPDPDTAEARFEERGALGPAFTLAFVRRLVLDSGANLRLTYVPTFFGDKTKGKTVAAYLGWRFALTPLLFAEGALTIARDEMETPVTCPAAADGCKSTATTTSTVDAARLGLGARF
jgi:hypothetical protein